MTAHVPAHVAAEILAKVDALSKDQQTSRALDLIASEYGLMLPELRTLMAKRPTASKPCSACGVVKPLTDFYEATNTISGRASQCIPCNNKRPPTVTRMVRNRARNRAYAVLAERHAVEFKAILAEQTTIAAAEHQQLQAAAAGRPDATVARLKPGPKRKGETDTAQRLDVARCPSCHTHHDAAHQCPSCGDTTPETTPSVRAFEVRAWAIEQGIPIPSRGPLPAETTAAFMAAHPERTTA